jgi:RHS repeat-associated protein
VNLRYPGQVFDPESGLHYNQARYYDPTTGRYLSPDPIGLAGGVNTYGYAENNPLRYTDPLGLWRNPSDIYDDAVNDARRSGLPGPHNGAQDAYRHCLASCETARENTAAAAQCLAWANEKKGDWTHNQERGERSMDDHNNAVGIGFGGTAKSTQDCRNACMGTARSGVLKTYESGSTPGYWRQ